MEENNAKQMLIDNIKNDNAYKLNLSFRKPTPLQFLDHKNFEKI